MKSCAKYRSVSGHHLSPAGDCNDCVYFCAKNCGRHTAEGYMQPASNLIY